MSGPRVLFVGLVRLGLLAPYAALVLVGGGHPPVPGLRRQRGLPPSAQLGVRGIVEAEVRTHC